MAFDARAIANFILKLAADEHVPVSPLKLQKLVYFAHGFYLAITNQPLIDEDVQAWEYGPVIPSIYHEFKRFGNRSITEYAMGYNDIENALSVIDIEDCGDGLAQTAKAIIVTVWESFKDCTAIWLSSITHMSETPWAKAMEENTEHKKHFKISDDNIKSYFAKQISI